MSADAGRPAPDPPPPRLTSLDVFRGSVVALLVLVEWTLPSPGHTWLRHSPWDGIRVADVVFPMFLFMVGASAALAERPRLGRLLKRTALLVVVGLLFNAWGGAGADLSRLRVTGVLQMIAVAGLLAGLVTHVVRRPLVVGGIGVAVAAVHGLVLSHAPIECGTGSIEPGCSAAWSLDDRVLPVEHLYRLGEAGHDPEGVLNTVLGATALVLLGWAASRLLFRSGRPLLTGALGAGLLALAGAAVLVWPLHKRVWTPSFSLLMAAGGSLALLALAIALDRLPHRRPQPVRWTFAALGRNALLVYVGQHVVLAALFATPTGDTSLAFALLERVGSVTGVAVLAVAAWTAVAAVLHALDWHWTA